MDASTTQPRHPPGLIQAAGRRYGVDLSRSVMIGDSAKDIECARNAGCGKAVLVKTGKDDAAEDILKAKQIDADYTAIDLFDAANWILANSPLTQ